LLNILMLLYTDNFKIILWMGNLVKLFVCVCVYVYVCVDR